MESTQENEIIIYQPDETLKLDVQVEGDTVWLYAGSDDEVISDYKTEHKPSY